MQIKWNTLTFVGNNQHLFHFELNIIVKTDLSIKSPKQKENQ